MNDLPRYVYGAKDFVPGKTQVLYSGPYWDHEEIDAAVKTLATGAWITSGTEVFKFQLAFARKFDVRFAQMVNSGSSANLVMIAALKKRYGWQDGDEVIVSPVGFPTTIAPLVQNGLKPVFVDIEMDTLNFDLDKVKTAIIVTKGRVVGIFVSPVLGNPPNMDIIKGMSQWAEIGENIKIIGDNCDSLGTKWNDKLLTDHYVAWSTSFYPAHHISTGEGGMVCSDDDVLMNHARSISWWGRGCYCVGAANLLPCGTCGKRFSKWLGEDQPLMDHKYVFETMGYNLKPLDLQGSIGLVQLKKFDEIERRRKDNYARISQALASVPQIKNAKTLAAAEPSWFGVPIICESGEVKASFQSHLEAHRIQTRNYFAGNILVHPGYRHLDDYRKYPNANEALRKVFFLGCAPHYNEPILQYIEEVIRKWVP